MTKSHISAACSPLPELGVTPAAFVVFAHLAGLGVMPRFAPYVTGRLIRLERNRPHRTESLRSDETGAICPASATCGGLDSPGAGCHGSPEAIGAVGRLSVAAEPSAVRQPGAIYGFSPATEQFPQPRDLR